VIKAGVVEHVTSIVSQAAQKNYQLPPRTAAAAQLRIMLLDKKLQLAAKNKFGSSSCT
jgi:hypothetical protein